MGLTDQQTAGQLVIRPRGAKEHRTRTAGELVINGAAAFVV
jgi:hypothetical protein